MNPSLGAVLAVMSIPFAVTLAATTVWSVGGMTSTGAAVQIRTVLRTTRTVVTQFRIRGETMDKTRRGFLKSLGVSAGAAAAVVVPVAPRVEEEVIKVKKYEHELIKVEHFLTRGDGTQDGDLAMLMVDGHYKAHVLRNGKWSRQFSD